MREPTKREIEDKMAEAAEAMDSGSKWPGMSYEQGVEAALRWVLGEDGDPLAD